MAILHWFQVMLFSMAFCHSAMSLKRNSKEHQNHEISQKINVLAAVLPPFTYYNSSHGFFDGIDIRILKTIAERLHLKLIFTKADNFTRISDRNLR